MKCRGVNASVGPAYLFSQYGMRNLVPGRSRDTSYLIWAADPNRGPPSGNTAHSHLCRSPSSSKSSMDENILTQTLRLDFGNLSIFPQEILLYIIDILGSAFDDKEYALLHEVPSNTYLHLLKEVTPIKNLSRTSKAWRYFLLPILFSIVQLDPHLSGLFVLSERLEFWKKHSLFGGVKHILVYAHDNLNVESLRREIKHLLKTTSAKKLTIIARPEILAQLIRAEIHDFDSWQFRMPFHVIQLERAVPSQHRVEPDESTNTEISQHVLCHWTRCSYNQGSFVSGYLTYEYHNLQPPSLLLSSSVRKSGFTQMMSQTLRSLEIVAVFPFDRREAFGFITTLVGLEKLSVQLAPTSTSSEGRACASASSSASPDDYWYELEGNYRKLREYLESSAGKSLSEYVMADFQDPGYRSVIETCMDGIHSGWTMREPGRWTRSSIRS